jgi:hypothetical protein
MVVLMWVLAGCGRPAVERWAGCWEPGVRGAAGDITPDPDRSTFRIQTSYGGLPWLVPDSATFERLVVVTDHPEPVVGRIEHPQVGYERGFSPIEGVDGTVDVLDLTPDAVRVELHLAAAGPRPVRIDGIVQVPLGRCTLAY